MDKTLVVLTDTIFDHKIDDVQTLRVSNLYIKSTWTKEFFIILQSRYFELLIKETSIYAVCLISPT